MAAGNLSEAERAWNEKVYKKAEEYLRRITPDEIDLERYFAPDDTDLMTLKDVYVQFIHSAQNYQRMPKVIAFDKRKNEVREILDGFNYLTVSEWNPKDLYQEFRTKFDIQSEDTKYNSWYKWSCSIVDSAKFLREFSSVEDFRTFVSLFDYNVHTRMALPLLISEKISGIGFALACDLLKELGFSKYPKPDVHLIEVFSKLGLSSEDPLDNFEAIVRMSDICQEFDETATPYKVDKIIWLICSGRYYHEKPEYKQLGHKDDFIEMMLKEK